MSYEISRITTDRSFAKSGLGCMILCRDLSVTVIDQDSGHSETYLATITLADESFSIRSVSVETPKATTEYTLSPDTVGWLVQDYYE